MTRKIVTPLILLVLFLSIGTIVSADGIEQNREPYEPKTETVTTTMQLDCQNITDSALEYAQKQGWCSERGTTVGYCGTASLVMTDHPWTVDDADFSLFLASSRGSMAIVNWGVSWTNWTTGSGNGFGGNSYPFSSTWSTFETRETGSGFVTGVFSGTVTLWWGGTCYIVPPSDSVTVQ
jgi:hypothetical protein